MSLQHPVPLSDVHSELSCLLFATQEGLKDLGVSVKIEYNQYTYLDVLVEVWGTRDMVKRVQAVVDRLNHGILWDGYDYRFRGVSHLTNANIEAFTSCEVRASVNLRDSKRTVKEMEAA